MLSERNQKILCAIVESYINSSTPVGSRLVTRKYAFNLSPASIRNIMADLEETGFLTQPHASAGRVPTDKGYRVYVDSLCMGVEKKQEELYTILRIGLQKEKVDTLNTVLSRVTMGLSNISHYLAFAAPVSSAVTLNRIQLYRYKGSQTVAVILTNEGIIKNRVILTDFGLSQKDLSRISEYLNSEFSGWSLNEIRLKIVEELSKERQLCDILISKATAICKEAFQEENEIFMAGFSEFLTGLLGVPDLAGRIKEIASAIEDKHCILRLLEELSFRDGVDVVIGSENPLKEMTGLSIVFAPYKKGNRALGCLGVIGPTRMNYSKMIPLIKSAVISISDVISGG